jgi:hypothetical protein
MEERDYDLTSIIIGTFARGHRKVTETSVRKNGGSAGIDPYTFRI